MSKRNGPQRVTVGPYDDTGSSVLHVDMDAFYAAVSLMSRPELVGTPVVIGGGTRGVVLSATYEARAYGIHAAMPIGRARRLCPQATFVRPDYERYAVVSAAVMAILRDVTPHVEPGGQEEAFLEVSGARRRLGSPAVIAAALRDQIADEVGVTASVGVGPNKLVAKVASGLAKPDGLLVIPAHAAVTFLHELPVGALWGIGEATEGALHRLGLTTVGELAHTPVETLQRALGPHAGEHLHRLAWGRDDRRVEPLSIERSIGNGRTFPTDVDDPAVIYRQLLALAGSVGRRARAAGHVGRTVTVTVRFADFTTISRARTLRRPTSSSQELYATAREIYDALHLQRVRVRMLNVRLSSITDATETPVQTMIADPTEGWREAEAAMDQVAARFGTQALRPATLLAG